MLKKFFLLMAILFFSCADNIERYKVLQKQNEIDTVRVALTDYDRKEEALRLKSAGIDTAKIIVIPANPQKLWYVFEVTAKPDTLNTEEVIATEKILNSSIEKSNYDRRKFVEGINKERSPKDQRDINYWNISLPDYYRQYIVTVNSHGEKIVRIQCACDVNYNPNWKNQEWSVADGGKCYFDMTINLTKKTHNRFHINSEG